MLSFAKKNQLYPQAIHVTVITAYYASRHACVINQSSADPPHGQTSGREIYAGLEKNTDITES